MQDAIQFITHDQIDKARWDNCVLHAINGLIYARSEYLDAMSPGWDAFVLGDYEAIMPITWRKKMGIRYACQPAFVQQLGVFYTNEKYRDTVPHFLEKTAGAFKLAEIFLNYDNCGNGIVGNHQNYILNLDADYTAIRKNFSKNLLNSLKRAEKYDQQYLVSDDSDNAIEQYKKLFADRMHIRENDFDQFKSLARSLVKKGEGLVREVRLKSGELLAISFILKDKKRLYNITSATLPNGRTLEANYVLMDHLIREFSGTGLLLDFEGSDLPGVAKFYRKFGPQSQPYAFWKINRLPAVLRWLKNK